MYAFVRVCACLCACNCAQAHIWFSSAYAHGAGQIEVQDIVTPSVPLGVCPTLANQLKILLYDQRTDHLFYRCFPIVF